MKKRYILFGCVLVLLCVLSVLLYNYYFTPIFRLAITTDSDLPPVYIENNAVLEIPYPKAYLFELKRNGDLCITYGGRRHDGNIQKRKYIYERHTKYFVTLNVKQIDMLVQMADKINIESRNYSPQTIIGENKFAYFLYQNQTIVYPFQESDFPELEEFIEILLHYYPCSIII